MTTWLKVTATCLQDITIGTGATRAFMSPTMDHVPGSTVRGALARAWRFKHGDGHPQFRVVFDGAVRFGPLRARGSDVANQSVWGCKYHADHGEPEYLDAAFACPHCGREGTVDPCPGCGVSPRVAPSMCGRPGERLKGTIMFGAQSTKLVTSTAIDPERMSALESSLFAREVFPRGTVFDGHIVGDPTLTALLKDFERIALGGRKSVLGAVQLAVEEVPAPLPAQPTGPVVLRTVSPTILVDHTGAPSVDLRAAFPVGVVADIWGGRLAADGTSGWHAASRLPKPGDVALAPGAVIALSGIDGHDLRRLLDEGIGLRRPEGFGWLEIVEGAWKPPAKPAVQEVQIDAVVVHRFGPLTRPERKWLAGWLRVPREWDDSHYFAALWETATGKNLNPRKREIVRELLEATLPGDRNALASELERV